MTDEIQLLQKVADRYLPVRKGGEKDKHKFHCIVFCPLCQAFSCCKCPYSLLSPSPRSSLPPCARVGPQIPDGGMRGAQLSRAKRRRREFILNTVIPTVKAL